MRQISVQTEPFDISAVQDELRAASPAIGALVSFVGLMRDINEGARIHTMTLEHYPGMTERALEAIVAEAHERWELIGSRVIHRVGELKPQDPIVLVAVTSAHRGTAFQACEFIIDYLKSRAPFWKKERTPEGERWVDARDTDQEAQQRWEGGDAPPSRTRQEPPLMTLETFLQTLRERPETVEFDQTMAIIDQRYRFTPTAFRNGDLHNEAGQNSGSCKIFAFGRLHNLSEAQTLACFGRYYRKDVLSCPDGTDHRNIRNFMETGWAGIAFRGEPLSPRSTGPGA